MAMFWPMLPTKADPGFRVMWGVSENGGYLTGVLFFVRILLYEGALFSETPMCWHMWPCLRLDHVEFRLESLGQEASFLGQSSSLLGLLDKGLEAGLDRQRHLPTAQVRAAAECQPTMQWPCSQVLKGSGNWISRVENVSVHRDLWA